MRPQREGSTAASAPGSSASAAEGTAGDGVRVSVPREGLRTAEIATGDGRRGLCDATFEPPVASGSGDAAVDPAPPGARRRASAGARAAPGRKRSGALAAEGAAAWLAGSSRTSPMRCTKNIAATASTPSALHATSRSPREPLVSWRTSSGSRSSAPEAGDGGSDARGDGAAPASGRPASPTADAAAARDEGGEAPVGRRFARRRTDGHGAIASTSRPCAPRRACRGMPQLGQRPSPAAK